MLINDILTFLQITIKATYAVSLRKWFLIERYMSEENYWIGTILLSVSFYKSHPWGVLSEKIKENSKRKLKCIDNESISSFPTQPSNDVHKVSNGTLMCWENHLFQKMANDSTLEITIKSFHKNGRNSKN